MKKKKSKGIFNNETSIAFIFSCSFIYCLIRWFTYKGLLIIPHWLHFDLIPSIDSSISFSMSWFGFHSFELEQRDENFSQS